MSSKKEDPKTEVWGPFVDFTFTLVAILAFKIATSAMPTKGAVRLLGLPTVERSSNVQPTHGKEVFFSWAEGQARRTDPKGTCKIEIKPSLDAKVGEFAVTSCVPAMWGGPVIAKNDPLTQFVTPEQGTAVIVCDSATTTASIEERDACGRLYEIALERGLRPAMAVRPKE